MSAGRVSAGFLFWAQRPQIAGMTATQKNCAAERSRSFFAQMPKGFEDISSRKVETRNEIQTKMETRRASQTILPTVPQVQREAAFE